MKADPGEWCLCIATGLMVLVVASKIGMIFVPDEVKRAMNDPTTIYFKPVETYGKECKDMTEEAQRRGARHWICGK